MALLSSLAKFASSVGKAMASTKPNTTQTSSSGGNSSKSYSSPNPTPQPAPLQNNGYAGVNQGKQQSWGKEQDTYYNYTPEYKVTSPSGGNFTVGKDQAEVMFNNMVKGGYATEADRSKYLQATGNNMKSYDLKNTNISIENSQMRNQYENDRYNKDPQGTLLARAQEQDDQLRYQHYQKTGENLPADYYMKQIQEEQQAVQNRVQSFQNQNSGIADATKPGTQVTAMAQNVSKAMNPQTPQGQYAYQNMDMNGNVIGTTYGESGRSNALPGASYVKAPNGQVYQTANFGSGGASPVNSQVMNTGMQAPAMNADLSGSVYMNPQDYMMKDNSKAIDAQYEAMARAQQAQLQGSLGQTLSDINSARSGLSAQYDPAKNDLYAQGRLNEQGIQEYMGSLGMEGGQNITAQARNNNSTQQAIGQVEAQKQAQDGVLQKAAIDAQRASSMEELSQMYQVNAQKIQAILQDSQQTNQANMQAMKEAFQFNYQSRADELARQQDAERFQYQMNQDNRNFMYGASQDTRNNFNSNKQFEYEQSMNDRDFNFKQDQAKIDQANWERQFNLSQQKKNSGGGGGGSRGGGGSSSSSNGKVDTNTLKASLYSTIDEKLNMVPMGSNGKPQYNGQYNTRAAQKWLDDNRNTIIQELGETSYKTYQTYINSKPSVGS